MLCDQFRKANAISIGNKRFSCPVPKLALRVLQKLLLQALVLWCLCYKEPFVAPWALGTLLSAKVTFNLSEVSLVDRCPNYLVTVFLAKNPGREEALNWNEVLLFFSLPLGFLIFKNNFHLVLRWCCFHAPHSASQIGSLSVPSRHSALCTDPLFQARDLRGHSLFSFQPSQALSLAALGEEMQAVLEQLLNPSIFVADLLCAHPILQSLISEAGNSVPPHHQDNLFMCVLDPTPRPHPGLGNLLSHFQAHVQPNV